MTQFPPIKILEETVTITGRRHCLVESHSNPGSHHVVEYADGEWRCSCIGWSCRHTCRHLNAVRAWARDEVEAELLA